MGGGGGRWRCEYRTKLQRLISPAKSNTTWRDRSETRRAMGVSASDRSGSSLHVRRYSKQGLAEHDCHPQHIPHWDSLAGPPFESAEYVPRKIPRVRRPSNVAHGSALSQKGKKKRSVRRAFLFRTAPPAPNFPVSPSPPSVASSPPSLSLPLRLLPPSTFHCAPFLPPSRADWSRCVGMVADMAFYPSAFTP